MIYPPINWRHLETLNHMSYLNILGLDFSGQPEETKPACRADSGLGMGKHGAERVKRDSICTTLLCIFMAV